MKQSEKATRTAKRYKLLTDKNNQIIVEEINQNELEMLWKTLTDVQSIF